MTTTRRWTEPLHAAPVLALAALLGGCGYDGRIAERAFLGGNTPIATFDPATPDAPAPAAPTTTLDRETWAPIDFLVPVDGTVHGPLWRWNARGDARTPRQKALYPTSLTALDLAPEGGASVRQAVAQPFVALANIIALPVLVFTDPPGNHLSPSAATLYTRSVRGRPVAGPIPAAPPEPHAP
jgi:hypothetical protein